MKIRKLLYFPLLGLLALTSLFSCREDRWKEYYPLTGRMPRMSGVEMAEEILKALPNAIILFMSAYSDKEYLKAAIKLKAVSYVDKPLDMNELTEALAEGS